MGLLRKVGLVILVVIGVGIGGAFYLGLLPPGDIQEPSASVADIGDWGEVSDNKIEVIHTLNVQNPNPVSAQVGNSTTLNLELQLNGIRLGSVQKTGLDIQQGNNTVPVTSELQQNQLSEFWARFINQDETIHAQISPSMEVNAGPGFSVSTPPVRVSALTNERPVSQAQESAGNEIEGTYTKQVSSEKLSDKYLPDTGVDIGPSQTFTAEYTVESVEFEWGEVTPDRTELLVHMKVKNTGETLLPGVPDGIATDILMNDIEVFHARGEAISVQNLDGDSVIRPGETRTYTLVAKADNQNIEQWFTTFASQREQSTVRTEVEFYFSLGDTSISIPQDGAVAYECSFQTGIFVDNQSTATTCGENGTIEIGPTQINESTITGESTNETTETHTTGPTENGSPPSAHAQANQTQGKAESVVSFDASESTDPDGDIERYVWRFDDGSSPAEGKQLTHTFSSAGEYTVELTVIDGQGNTDTDTVTVTVEAKSSEPPTAVAEATPTSGEAPLEVEFDASGSSDPDEDIEKYVWRFKDGSAPAEGETFTHTFQTAGEYEVELVVFDSQGNQDSTTVTVTVESRVG